MFEIGTKVRVNNPTETVFDLNRVGEEEGKIIRKGGK